MIKITINNEEHVFIDDELNTGIQKAVYFLQQQELDPLESESE